MECLGGILLLALIFGLPAWLFMTVEGDWQNGADGRSRAQKLWDWLTK